MSHLIDNYLFQFKIVFKLHVPCLVFQQAVFLKGSVCVCVCVLITTTTFYCCVLRIRLQSENKLKFCVSKFTPKKKAGGRGKRRGHDCYHKLQELALLAVYNSLLQVEHLTPCHQKLYCHYRALQTHKIHKRAANTYNTIKNTTTLPI